MFLPVVRKSNNVQRRCTIVGATVFRLILGLLKGIMTM